MDRTVASQTWEALANAIDEIYNRNASQLSFEELYRNAYNLVLHKHGTLLYEGVTEKLNEHLSATARRLANVNDEALLEEISSTWKEHQVGEASNLLIRRSLTGWSCAFLGWQELCSLTMLPFSIIYFADHHDHGP